MQRLNRHTVAVYVLYAALSGGGNNPMTGQQLRDLRLANNLSMAKLAEITGYSRQSIHNWEHGKHQISRANQAFIRDRIRWYKSSGRFTEIMKPTGV